MSDILIDYIGLQCVLFGMQLIGFFYLGNYLGVLKNWVFLQEDGNWDCFYCVVDFYVIIMLYDLVILLDVVCFVVVVYIVFGVDLFKSVIFVQFVVFVYVELVWIFNCVVCLGWFECMIQFKDKVGKDKECVLVGLFIYLVLQVVDILVYKVIYVFVGEDQKQYLELCCDIVVCFNCDYGDGEVIFLIIELVIQGFGVWVMLLCDGVVKMFKFDVLDNLCINLDDDVDKIVCKIKKVKIDFELFLLEEVGLVDCLEVFNLVGIYVVLMGKIKVDILVEFGGQGFGVFKLVLVDVVVEYFVFIFDEYCCLVEDKIEIDCIFVVGVECVNVVVVFVVMEVKEIIGFWG